MKRGITIGYSVLVTSAVAIVFAIERGWFGLVSHNQLSVGCVTTPRRQSGDFAGF